jgi:hypothetical protein
MRRRSVVVAGIGWAGALAGGTLWAGCAPGGQGPAPSQAAAQPEDIKQVASRLQVKTVALIDAINAHNDANIARAKSELQQEADRAEDAVKSQTGVVPNQVNAAVLQIRTGVLNNDLTRLERARTLLQMASQ